MRARVLDRLVHWATHPLVFIALGVGRRTGLPGRVIVDDAAGVREVLAKVPLDRTAQGTTGGLVQDVGSEGESWFDGSGAGHRRSRRELGRLLGTEGVKELRGLWRQVFEQYRAALRSELVDAVTMTRVASGLVTLRLLGEAPSKARALALTEATREVARRSVRAHLTGGPGDDLDAPLRRSLPGIAPSDAMLAVAATTTVQSAIPRALAWCADDRLWDQARRDPATMAAELTRVLAPSPLLPRIAAQEGAVGGRRFGAGASLLLHLLPAIGWAEPSVERPRPAGESQLAFGVGPHACPGRALALAMTADALATFAEAEPSVRRRVPDWGAGLPQWRELWLA